ncbi:MAG: Ribosomal RNA small subunit methyltransferase H [Elusimicrobia bacterium]|nr:Ribosomal RNA small subunit methyltransferase H [Elusimicrobiota bacterium]
MVEAHKSVLLKEAIEWLNVKPNGLYVDGTLGLGGHAEAIAQRLGEHGRLLGLDVDSKNLAKAERLLQPFGKLIRTKQINFRELNKALVQEGWDGVDGLLFDLGVASPQLESAERGFSFQSEGPLDMRLDPSHGKSAYEFLSTIKEEKLVSLLKEFGEERNAHRLARSILFEVSQGRLNTTRELATLCSRYCTRGGKSHPATRVFLALRSMVNDELGALEDLLSQSPDALKIGGRLVIISFHSLEDRKVKEKFRVLSREPSLNGNRFVVLTKKPVVPSFEEQRENPRARSAKLRVLERVA